MPYSNFLEACRNVIPDLEGSVAKENISDGDLHQLKEKLIKCFNFPEDVTLELFTHQIYPSSSAHTLLSDGTISGIITFTNGKAIQFYYHLKNGTLTFNKDAAVLISNVREEIEACLQQTVLQTYFEARTRGGLQIVLDRIYCLTNPTTPFLVNTRARINDKPAQIKDFKIKRDGGTYEYTLWYRGPTKLGIQEVNYKLAIFKPGSSIVASIERVISGPDKMTFLMDTGSLGSTNPYTNALLEEYLAAKNAQETVAYWAFHDPYGEKREPANFGSPTADQNIPPRLARFQHEKKFLKALLPPWLGTYFELFDIASSNNTGDKLIIHLVEKDIHPLPPEKSIRDKVSYDLPPMELLSGTIPISVTVTRKKILLYPNQARPTYYGQESANSPKDFTERHMPLLDEVIAR